MAELLVQSNVPARWRFLFTAALPLLFLAAVLLLSRPGNPPVRDPVPADEQEYLNARTRLETAAIAFSSGKLNPDIAIITDHPEVYAPEQDPTQVPDDTLFFWSRMIDSGIELNMKTPLPREFQWFGFPVLADSRDGEAWSVFLDGKHNPRRFDLILLDCAFPARITSPGITLWTTQTFATLAQERAKTGTVFAVVLPQNRPQAAACTVTAMKNVFGNIGTFRFGERIVAASSVPMSAATRPENLKDVLRRPPPSEDGETQSPVFSLSDINENATLAGYYTWGKVPPDAIYHILQQDYSDAPPAWLLESIHGNGNRLGRSIGTLAYAKAEILPHLKKNLPGGVPYGKVCAWSLGIALLVYLLLRYFISWKPVHKQAFLAFEDMFLFTGSLAIFCTALPDFKPFPLPGLRWLWFAALPLLSLVFLLSFKWPTKVKRKSTCVIYLLVAVVFYALAFWLEQLPAPSGFFRQILMATFLQFPVGFLSDLVQNRIQKPVQSGPAIPLAFVLGVAASLAVFAVSLFFPAGPIVFAGLICGFRLVFLEN